MIPDLDLGGILVPGMLALAGLALVLTVVVLRLLAVAGVARRLAARPLLELAVFVFLLALLVEGLPAIGPHP